MNSIKQTDMQMCTVYVNLSHNTLTINIVEREHAEGKLVYQRLLELYYNCSTAYAAIHFSML
jgi:hypothetical protein